MKRSNVWAIVRTAAMFAAAITIFDASADVTEVTTPIMSAAFACVAAFAQFRMDRAKEDEEEQEWERRVEEAVAICNAYDIDLRRSEAFDEYVEVVKSEKQSKS